MTHEKTYSRMTVRPYQILCIVCSFGEDPSGPKGGRLKDILEAVRATPDMPIALCCNMHDLCAYQNQGTQDDTPEGADYNKKRDMEMIDHSPVPWSWRSKLTVITHGHMAMRLDSVDSDRGPPKNVVITYTYRPSQLMFAEQAGYEIDSHLPVSCL